MPEPSDFPAIGHNLALSNKNALLYKESSVVLFVCSFLFCLCLKSVSERIQTRCLLVSLIHSCSPHLCHRYQVPGTVISIGATKNCHCLCRTDSLPTYYLQISEVGLCPSTFFPLLAVFTAVLLNCEILGAMEYNEKHDSLPLKCLQNKQGWECKRIMCIWDTRNIKTFQRFQ